MEAAGLTIAVFNEVFVIGKFIRQVLIDARDQDSSFRKLESDFEHQQILLSTFGRRFLESKSISKIEHSLRGQIRKILGELKRLVGEYGRLAARYDKEYAKALEGVDEWWEIGIGSSGKPKDAGEPKVIHLESIEIPGPTKPVAHEKKPAQGGLHLPRAQFSPKFASLKWALSNREKLESLVRGHGDWVGKLMEIIKLDLFTRDGFSSNLSELEDFQRKDAKALGMSKITATRMLFLDPSQGKRVKLKSKLITAHAPTNAAPPIGEGDLRNGKYNNQNVLIEYKSYPENSSDRVLEIAKGRIQFLSKLLGVECRNGEPTRSNDFTLRCLGFFHKRRERLYGLAFALPQDREPEPMSLHTAIGSLKRQSRPTLGQRFAIAHNIGYTLIEWFLIDWVHKSINSKNILFFRQESQGLDFDSPYLCGFEYARPALDGTIYSDYGGSKGVHWNIYRHPDRQGLPTEGFRKIHDIYAFGVLLLELGLWKLAPELLDPKAKATPRVIHKTLVRNAREKLGHFMGQKYQDAVLLCLESSLAVELDDQRGSRLIAAFKEKVVAILEEGRKL